MTDWSFPKLTTLWFDTPLARRARWMKALMSRCGVTLSAIHLSVSSWEWLGSFDGDNADRVEEDDDDDDHGRSSESGGSGNTGRSATVKWDDIDGNKSNARLVSILTQRQGLKKHVGSCIEISAGGAMRVRECVNHPFQSLTKLSLRTTSIPGTSGLLPLLTLAPTPLTRLELTSTAGDGVVGAFQAVSSFRHLTTLQLNMSRAIAGASAADMLLLRHLTRLRQLWVTFRIGEWRETFAFSDEEWQAMVSGWRYCSSCALFSPCSCLRRRCAC